MFVCFLLDFDCHILIYYIPNINFDTCSISSSLTTIFPVNISLPEKIITCTSQRLSCMRRHRELEPVDQIIDLNLWSTEFKTSPEDNIGLKKKINNSIIINYKYTSDF